MLILGALVLGNVYWPMFNLACIHRMDFRFGGTFKFVRDLNEKEKIN